MKKICRLCSLLLCLMLMISAIPAFASPSAEELLIPDPANYIDDSHAIIDLDISDQERQLDLGFVSSEGKTIKYTIRSDGMPGLSTNPTGTKVVIPANYAGIAEIRVSDGSYYDDFYLYVYPASPKFTVSSTVSGEVLVSWTPVTSASGYAVDYSVNENLSGYTDEYVYSQSATSMTLKGLTPGEKLYIRVRSFVSYGSEEPYWWINSYDNDVLSVTVSSEEPAVVKVKSFAVVIKGKKANLKNKTLTLSMGKTLKLAATNFRPVNADNTAVRWSSSNQKVAKISAAGIIKALKKGTCFIKATAKDGSGVSVRFKLIVK